MGRVFIVFLLGAGAWGVSIGSHELIGHGGVCAVDPQCRWIYADGMYFGGAHGEGAWRQAELAGGAVFNIVFALLCGLWLAAAPPAGWAFRVFLWALATVGLVQSGSYIAFGPFIHEGMDWARLRDTHGWPYPVLAALGGGAVLAGLGLSKFGLERREIVRGSRVTLILPAWAGFAASAVAVGAILPTQDRELMLLGAVGSSVFFMAWMLLLFIPLPGLRRTAAAMTGADRSVIILATVLGLAYVFWLGPGIGFN